MNNDTRKRLDDLMDAAKNIGEEHAKAVATAYATYKEAIDAYKSMVDDLYESIIQIKDEEQERFDNLSEGLQASERGQAMEAAVTALEGALNEIENVADNLDIDEDAPKLDTDSVITALDEAKAQ